MPSKYSFFQRLKDELPYLKPAQARIARFIIKDPRLVISITIKELSRHTNTAPSTVVDFCKKLNFRGFRDLKIELAQELEMVESMKFNLNKVSKISKNLLEVIQENLQFSLPQLLPETIEKACDHILNSKTIDIMAYGFDGVAGHDLFIKMKTLGFQVNFFDNPFLQSLSAYQMGPDSTAIVISSSHSSSDLLDSMKYARETGAKIISMAPPDSKILERSDVKLPLFPKTKILPEGGILTRYIQLLAVDTLFLELIQMGKDKFKKSYSNFEYIINYKRRGDEGVV
ncbi:MAG: hypothetical protein PWQ77_1472 [Kosmotogales bacterium]|nr:hypothetical protein [Kosmotogales bacterium]